MLRPQGLLHLHLQRTVPGETLWYVQKADAHLNFEWLSLYFLSSFPVFPSLTQRTPVLFLYLAMANCVAEIRS